MTSEPNQEGDSPVTYFRKGQDSYSLCKNEEALSYFNKAIEINPNDADYYYNKGLAFEGLGKDEEAVMCYDKAIKINPNDRNYHSKKVLTLQKLGRGQEALDYYGKAIEIEPENIIFYEYKALILQRMGRSGAGICLTRIEEIKWSKWNKSKLHFSEGLMLKSQGKYQEAVLEFNKAIEMNEKSTNAHFYKGLTLLSLDKDQEALFCFDKTIETTMTPENPMYYCVRGRTLRSLNKQQDALTDFKKAQEICKSGGKKFFVSIPEVEYLTIIVDSILELHKAVEIAEKILGQLEKKKFVEDLNALQGRREKLTTDLLAKIEEKYSGKIPQEKILTFSQLKEDFVILHKEMKEEVDDFYKKSDDQIGDLDISPDDHIRVKEYFNAFVGTFRLAFEGSQAIENENYQLDVGCLFSTFASVAPKDTSGITCIEKFLLTKEIQTNAKKMLELFFDCSVYLNAMIGKTAEKIVLSQNKREKILSITDGELDKISGNLLKKISKFCEQMNGPMDIDLYKQLYNTPAARLGHMDANDLIQEYLEGKISVDKVQEEFVENTLKRQRVINQIEAEEIKIQIKEKKDRGKGKCCSIF